ncbi:MAG: mechanosensitive ion channel family protein [Hyphomicrobiales bacterium]
MGAALQRLLLIVATLVLCWLPASADPQVAPKPAATEEVPAKVKDLIDLLKDPTVAEWLTKQAAAKPASSGEGEMLPNVQQMAMGWFDAARNQLLAVKIAFTHKIPVEARNATMAIASEMQAYGLSRAWPLIVGFLLVGLGSLFIAMLVTRSAYDRFTRMPVATVSDRLRAIRGRAEVLLVRVLAFFAGSFGVFLLFDWPPLVRATVSTALLGAQGLAVAMAVSALLLAPPSRANSNTARVRMLPMEDRASTFWFRAITVMAALLSFGMMVGGAMDRLGFSADSRLAVSYVFALALAVAFLVAVWRAPSPAEGNASERQAWLLTVYVALLLFFWMIAADFLFWLTLLAGALPFVIWMSESGVRHVVRAVGDEADPAPGLFTAAVQRGVRTLFLLGGLLLLERELPTAMGMGSDVTQILSGIIRAIMILIVFDFVWHLTSTFLSRQIASLQMHDGDVSANAVRRQRLGTLLPIAKNVLFVAFAAMAVLMALSAMDVPIGPLLAGASIFGVAIGFGSQTLVKDVLSGVFYLLDDAFRVGEYIESGSYKGTVEGFTLRSIKLRHQRGPIYTVPFGSLGAIQNQSRDWVIEKMLITVPFGTNIMKAKKLIKQVGQELLEDPEIKPSIIETLKMQGVEEFGDYGIKLRLKLMTKPGEQFTARRRAFARIKELFEQNGIGFASAATVLAPGAGPPATVPALGLQSPPPEEKAPAKA